MTQQATPSCCGGDKSTPSDPVAARLLANRATFLSFVAKRVPDRAAAEDVLQEALTKALQRGDALRDEASSVAWFYRILRNGIVDHKRRASAAQRAIASFADEPSVGEATPVDAPKTCACVARVASSLRPDYAKALQRVEVEGVAVKDLAKELGISATNAAVRTFRARKALHREVMSTCGSCAAKGCTDCTCEGVS